MLLLACCRYSARRMHITMASLGDRAKMTTRKMACSLCLLPFACLASAYPEQPGGMRAPFVYPHEQQAAPAPPPAAGISFAGVFTDHTVLQRGAKTKVRQY